MIYCSLAFHEERAARRLSVFSPYVPPGLTKGEREIAGESPGCKNMSAHHSLGKRLSIASANANYNTCHDCLFSPTFPTNS
ncbi:unnamed protein product [Allacma fusca]|uniref:Uncharacterized protein n=1 Tax=Allacma fusca TaxID=39272 RepID=A0A8J2PBM8_9HEXA|nr:unnamed protein product [Allacma fusca]